MHDNRGSDSVPAQVPDAGSLIDSMKTRGEPLS